MVLDPLAACFVNKFRADRGKDNAGRDQTMIKR